MPASFVTDLDIVDQSTVENTAALYPVAQWLHGDPKLAAVGGIVHTGGIIIPTRHLPDKMPTPAGWAHTTVAFSSGKSEDVLACARPKLAVIRTRFRWFMVFNGVASYYPRSSYAAPMRGHLQALCGLAGFDFPVLVAFKGKASQEFEKILKEFGRVGEAAKRLIRGGKGEKFPRFAFYMRLAAGPHVKVGQKGQESIITPPVIDLPENVTEEYLSKAYVGRDNLLAYQEYYHEAAEWAAAWDRFGNESATAMDDEQVDPPPDESTDPFMQPGGGGIVRAETPKPAADVLSLDQVKMALKLHGIDFETFKQAVVEANGRASYSPERDTPLVRRLIAQNTIPGELS